MSATDIEAPRTALSATQFEAFLQQCDNWDTERKRIENNLFVAFQQLEEAYNTKCMDLASEKRARMHFQHENAKLEDDVQKVTWSHVAKVERMIAHYNGELVQVRQTLDLGAFVSVIIDGDGAVFHEHLYALGRAGGGEAASLLYDEIMNHLKRIYPGESVGSWNIMVNIVCNLEGLGQKLYAINMVPTGPPDVMAFGAAFSVSQPLFNFINVATGKERADHKARELLRAYSRVPQCKHVIFGPSHETGYIPVLEQYRADSVVGHKLTLLETLPAHAGFADLGLPRVKFPTAFRSENLPMKPVTTHVAAPPGVMRAPSMHTSSISQHRPPSTNAQQPAIIGRTSSMPVTTNGISSPRLNLASPIPTPRTPISITHAPTTPPPATSISNSPAPTLAELAANQAGFVAVSKGTKITPSASNGMIIEVAQASKKQPRAVGIINKYDERLDKPLPSKDVEADRRLYERMQKYGKLCNKYHISGRCDAGDECEYNHGERLSQPDLLCLRHKARSIRCSKLRYCRDVNCFLGHHCPAAYAGKNCSAKFCQFKDTHSNYNMKPAKRFFEDGTESYIEN